ncbi:MAG: hypothetical protein V7K89_08460 [Nostoc sp.]|uniref:hypothetical protein n=1 Tax=Nostoc sp. TaxID=1180 RepID=UPI002FFCFB6C
MTFDFRLAVLACADITQKVIDEFAVMTGRQYQLFEYYADSAAELQIFTLLQRSRIR